MTSNQKRNWIQISNGSYSGPEKSDAKRVFILSIDDGCAWNPCGEETPQPNSQETKNELKTNKNLINLGWVWAHSDIPAYIDRLITGGDLVILYSKIKSPKPRENVRIAVDEMLAEIKESAKVGVFTGLTTGEIKSFLGNKSFVVIPEEIEIDKIGIDPFMNTGVFSTKPSQQVIVMVGQPGSGKTTISEKLVNKYEFIHIDEKRAGYIRNRNADSLSTELAEMKTTGKSLVIDATHPSRKMRQVYIDYIKKVWPSLPVRIGWVARPGFRLNSLRKEPKPTIALRIYRNNLEVPESDENWFRIV